MAIVGGGVTGCACALTLAQAGKRVRAFEAREIAGGASGPLVGRVPGRDGVWVPAGYYGHGNVLGLACGELLGRAILGQPPPELELFDPTRVLGRSADG